MNVNNLSKNIVIGVIGKSAAGKSAFIKSFSDKPELINSEGEGQTTRSYAEYTFLINNKQKDSIANIKLMSSKEFSDRRVVEIIEKLKKMDGNQKEITIEWIREQYNDIDYNKEMRKNILHSDDFFNINEFSFLDNGESVQKVNEFYDIVMNVLCNSEENRNNEDDNNIEIIKRILDNKEKCKENDEKEMVFIEDTIYDLFQEIYNILIEGIKNTFKDSNIYFQENGMHLFKFNINEENKYVLELFLKVIDYGEGIKKSYTALVANVKIINNICDDYNEILKMHNINSITLIDTYGLDHKESMSNDVLDERYHKIFNVDYPNISTVFFIEPLHKGASNDFVQAIRVLYSKRPDIMTYIIATYIDDHEFKFLENNSEWLKALDKTSITAPKLNGKVVDFIYNSSEILTVLKRNNISRSLAEKRLEIMKKRFGTFCGRVTENHKNFYLEINKTTIKSIFFSIVNREHLGDGYIEIDKVFEGIDKKFISKNIFKYLIDKVTEGFREIFEEAASRTRGSIRENLEKYTLGFDGSTIDATWLRAFNDAYNETFTKIITINNKKTTVSEMFGMEGNGKIAFDELINMFFPYIFMKFCNEGQLLNLWNREISCALCVKRNKFEEKCIWAQLINVAGKDNFGKRNTYPRVIDWLRSLHDFSKVSTEEFYCKLQDIFEEHMKNEFIEMCRQHNARVISKYIKVEQKSYLKSKVESVSEYKQNYDKNVNEEQFYYTINNYMINSGK